MSNFEGNINICSLNCQGLGTNDPRKRRDVFNYLRGKQFSILCLQDTHFSGEIERFVQSEWGYKAVFSSFSTRSRGVAVLFANNFEFKIHNTVHDTSSGNFLIIDLTIDSKRITLVNIYAPNHDDPLFFENINNLINSQGNKDIIVLGDWNLVLNPMKDTKNYKTINNPKAREKVSGLIADYNLVDVWRDANPESLKFTWKRRINKNTFQMARLDFVLISETLSNFCFEEIIESGYRSDHSLISFRLKFQDIPKKRTLWKFNNSLLRNMEYIEEIKGVIKETKAEYAASPYNRSNIDEIPNLLYQSYINSQLFFELLLLKMRSRTIYFLKSLRRKENTQMEVLVSEIKEIEDNLVADPSLGDSLCAKKESLQNLRSKMLEGTLIRARARWLQHGEKPTQYFCHLENRNFISKRMSSLILDTGEETSDESVIKDEVGIFYQRLYSSREHLVDNSELPDCDALKKHVPKLSEEDANSLEGLLTFSELSTALKNMNNNKSPGSDGFTVEFFKFFWQYIGHFLLKSINYGYENKTMSVTQKEGIITCIPKGDKCKKYIKNWRPITLLNVTYKIASAALANRLKKVLPSIINLNQCGFMANRFTGDNIRLVYDVLNYALVHKKRGLLILIDFEKAFDSISWSYLFKCLSFF